MNQPVLTALGLSKRYRIYASTRQRLLVLLRGLDTSESHWALKDVGFELHRGQCLGVIGDNGAGKSTLLKVLAGTLQPSSGRLSRSGRVTAILELGAGFHPDFSGRENLAFAGALIGLSDIELHDLTDEIIAFSELGAAIDRPVKTYSSGMVVRLAFALVTAVQPEVLIIDEALAVGDQHFQKKCVQRIETFRKDGCAILFCSHSLYHVRQLCDRTLWLDHGAVQALGDTETVLAGYESHVRKQNSTLSERTAANPLAELDQKMPGSDLSLESIQLNNQKSGSIGSQQNLGRGSLVSAQIENILEGMVPRLTTPDLSLILVARTPDDECPSFGVMIEQLNGVGITSVGNHADGVRPQRQDDGLWKSRITFENLPLHTGEYTVSVYLFAWDGLVVYEEWPKCLKFLHVNALSTPGLVRLPHHWS